MQDLKMPGTAKHSCLGSRTIFSAGAFKEMILAPVKRSLWSVLKSLLLSAEQDQVSHSWVKLKNQICTFPTWLKRERIDFLVVHSSGSEEAQILIIQKKCLVLGLSDSLQWVSVMELCDWRTFNAFWEGLGTGSWGCGVSLGICVCGRSQLSWMDPWLPSLSIAKRTAVKLKNKKKSMGVEKSGWSGILNQFSTWDWGC